MSLINQALKKAQRDRSGRSSDPASASGGSPGAPGAQVPPAYRLQSSGLNFGLFVGVIVAFALLLGLVAGLTVLLLRDSSKSTATSEPTESPSTAATVTADGPAVEAAPTTIPIAQANRESLPDEGLVPARPSTASNAMVEELRQARLDAEAKLKAQAEAEAEAEAAARLAEEQAAAQAKIKPDPEIIRWLGEARINAIRFSESGNRVVINGVSHGVNDTVHQALGIKLLIIQEKRLLFVDANGTKYMKTL